MGLFLGKRTKSWHNNITYLLYLTMKSKPIILFIMSVAVVLLGLSLYNYLTSAPISNIINFPESKKPVDSITPSVNPDRLFSANMPEQITVNQNMFGFNLFRELIKTNGRSNIIVSPSSIFLAMSMVNNGASGKTQTEITQALQVSQMTTEMLNLANLQMLESQNSTDQAVELAMANSVWVRSGVQVKDAFLTTLEKYYKASVNTLDFSLPSSADKINFWVQQNTREKISKIVESPLPKDYVLYLINAVYFKGQWTQEFDKSFTREENFSSPGGGHRVPFMKRANEMAYFETTDFQSVRLSYGKTEEYSMSIFLPKNLDAFLGQLNSENWQSWQKRYAIQNGTLLLPKFSSEYEIGLLPALRSLGIKSAFTNQAELNGIAPYARISDIRHKTFLEVNEVGTEAAAVTSIGIKTTSIDESTPKPFFMEVNKPFVFMIVDNKAQAILFLGVISNPG